MTKPGASGGKAEATGGDYETRVRVLVLCSCAARRRGLAAIRSSRRRQARLEPNPYS